MKKSKSTVFISVLLLFAVILSVGAGAWGFLELSALNGSMAAPDENAESVDALIDDLVTLRDTEDQYLEGADPADEDDEQTPDEQQQLSYKERRYQEGKSRIYDERARIADSQAQLDAAEQQYNRAAAQLEAARPAYEEGKDQLERWERLDPYLDEYVELREGILDYSPRMERWSAVYHSVIIPVAANNGLTLPESAAEFASYRDSQIAQSRAAVEEFERAERQLADAKAQLEETGKQLAEEGELIDEKDRALDEEGKDIYGKTNEPDRSDSQLYEDTAVPVEYEDAVVYAGDALTELLKLPDICDRKGNVAVESLQSRLGKRYNIYKYDDEKQLLSLPGGAPMLDYEKCLTVCETYREYVEDYRDDIGREIGSRSVLYIGLFILSPFVLITAIKGLKRKGNTVKWAMLALIAAALINVHGIAAGYLHYAHPVGKMLYTGMIPSVQAIVLLILLGIAFFVYKRAKENAGEEAAESTGDAPVPKQLSEPVTEAPVIGERTREAQENLTEAQRLYDEALKKYLDKRRNT